MAQDLAHVFGRQVIVHIQMDQAIRLMAQVASIKVLVERKEGWTIQLMQQRENLLITHAFRPNIATHLPRMDALAMECITLIVGKVLVQNVHTFTDSWPYSTAWSSKIRSARAAASAIASLPIRPPQAATMASQDFPLASCRRICRTMMRVPMNVGLPWQILGSATM